MEIGGDSLGNIMLLIAIVQEQKTLSYVATSSFQFTAISLIADLGRKMVMTGARTPLLLAVPVELATSIDFYSYLKSRQELPITII